MAELEKVYVIGVDTISSSTAWTFVWREPGVPLVFVLKVVFVLDVFATHARFYNFVVCVFDSVSPSLACSRNSPCIPLFVSIFMLVPSLDAVSHLEAF